MVVALAKNSKNPGPAAVPAAQILGKASDIATKALTGDLLRFQGRIYRVVQVGKGKKAETFLDPIDVDLHVNPISLGIGAAGLAIGGFLLFGTLRVPHPLGGQVELFRGPLASQFNTFIEEREKTKDDAQVLSCADLQEAYQRNVPGILEWFNPVAAAIKLGTAEAYRAVARQRGCEWAV